MTPTRRARLVLRKLEEAFEQRASRKTGGWVTTMELLRAAGVGFKVGIHELHNKKDPDAGLGFVIARRCMERYTRIYGYMITGYPIWWKKGRANPVVRIKPRPVGYQERLFPAA